MAAVLLTKQNRAPPGVISEMFLGLGSCVQPPMDVRQPNGADADKLSGRGGRAGVRPMRVHNEFQWEKGCVPEGCRSRIPGF